MGCSFISMFTGFFFPSNESRGLKGSSNTVPIPDKYKHGSLFTAANNLVKD